MRYTTYIYASALALVVGAAALSGCQSGPDMAPLVVVTDQSDQMRHFDNMNDLRVGDAPMWMAGGFGDDPGQFRHIGPIAIDSDGNTIVADNALKRLTWFRPDGTFLKTRSYSPGEGGVTTADTIRGIRGMTARHGKLYLAESELVTIVSADGSADRTAIEPGRGPVDIEVCGAGRLYVLFADRIRIYSPQGELLADEEINEGNGGMYARDMSIGPDDDLYVGGRLWDVVLQIDHATGKVVRRVGVAGAGEGKVQPARCVGVDGRGNLYMRDNRDNNIEVYSNAGESLGSFTEHGSGPGQTLGIEEIVVDPARDHLVFADNTNYRVQMYDLTGKDVAARDLVRHTVEHAPTHAPDFISLQLGNDPNTERRISWRTDTSAPASVAQVIRVDSAGAMVDWEQTVRTIEGDVLPYVSNFGPYIAHSASVGGLMQGSTYAYRVGDGSDDGWSRTGYFGIQAGVDRHLRAIVLGDSRNRMDVWEHVLTSAANEDPAMIVNTGDLVSNGENMGDWNQWFYRARIIFDRIPMMPCLGNHERQSPNFMNFFSLPENGPEGLKEQAYWFDYGPARWIVINTEIDIEKQARWMEEILADNTQPWVFTFYHRPAWAGHPSRGTGSEDVRAAWTPIFEKYGVDIAWQGHDHYYFRTKPMRGGEVVEQGEGPIYVTSGGAGAPLYPTEATPYSVVNESVDHYCVLDLTPESAHVKVFRADGSVLDEFSLAPRSPEPTVGMDK